MSAKFTSPEFEALQQEWYAKLKEGGFEDIEVLDPFSLERPLKKWATSFYEANRDIPGFGDTQREYAPIASSFPEGRYTREEAFLEREDFPVICENICRHGNRKLFAFDIRIIWVAYCGGETHRQIARKMNTSKQTIARVLGRIHEWMALL